MRDARALLASIGTSALLVAAVVASLLSVSVVFAVGGFDGAQAAESDQALVLDVKERARPARRSDDAPAALVVKAPAATGKSGRRSPSPRSEAKRSGRPTTSTATNSPQAGNAGGGVTGAAAAAHPSPAPAPAARKPNLGDGVTKLGDDLSSGVRKTGSDLAKLTAPLGAPVSAAVQQVVNVVAALLQQTTNAVGALLGAAPRR